MEQTKNDNRINDTIKTALENIKEMIDVNTVVGTPKNTTNGYFVPITNITLCVLSGGGEYGKTTIFNKANNLPFTAGNGAIISIKPCGFLVKDDSSGYRLLTTKEQSYEKIIDLTTEFIKNNAKNKEK